MAGAGPWLEPDHPGPAADLLSSFHLEGPSMAPLSFWDNMDFPCIARRPTVTTLLKVDTASVPPRHGGRTGNPEKDRLVCSKISTRYS